MAAIDYPSTLPCHAVGTFESDSNDPWVEDTPSVGGARRRKRFTRALGRFSYTLLMTAAEAAILETFYATTLDDGVSEFNWTHPLRGTTHEVRFSSYPKPKQLYANRYSADIVLVEI